MKGARNRKKMKKWFERKLFESIMENLEVKLGEFVIEQFKDVLPWPK